MSEVQVRTEIEVVRAFLAALERLDADAALDLLDPGIVYQNVPFPAARGERAVAKQLRGLAKYCSGFEARLHNVSADGPIVLTERTDVLEVGRLRADFWVWGHFEVRDGKIVVWRDYFDFANVTWAFLRGVVRALLPRR
jgi:limonene-1,2-epoxide hydrolase